GRVICKTFLYVSRVQMIPASDHTGPPLPSLPSIRWGSACLMRVRRRASVSPRQSFSSLILASISREGDSSPLPSFEPLLLFFIVVIAFFMVVVARPSLDRLGRPCLQPDRLQSVRAQTCSSFAKNCCHPAFAHR